MQGMGGKVVFGRWEYLAWLEGHWWDEGVGSKPHDIGTSTSIWEILKDVELKVSYKYKSKGLNIK